MQKRTCEGKPSPYEFTNGDSSTLNHLEGQAKRKGYEPHNDGTFSGDTPKGRLRKIEDWAHSHGHTLGNGSFSGDTIKGRMSRLQYWLNDYTPTPPAAPPKVPSKPTTPPSRNEKRPYPYTIK
ncbi:MAG: hypothetical protein PHE27_08505 [Alphaproteobacteria bacterium]|nr:hypothetical protein [Alphaproteobacteria bacterium]